MERQEDIAIRMQKAVQAGEIPGMVLALGDRHGTRMEAGFGARSLGGAEAMAPDSVFWIASMTKAITGVAAMMLVEAGKLSLDAPANTLVPEIGALGVLEGFDEAGQPKMRPAKRPITLRHLLTHTSGYAYDMWSSDIARFRKATGTPAVGTCRNAALALPLLFDPGEHWSYGIGIDWAGKMIEAATGETLGVHLQRVIFEPLGMVDTSFKLHPDQRARLAAMHGRGADGALSVIPFEVPQEPEFETGGGGLYGTARDYLTFARMILNGGKHGDIRLLKAVTIADMARDHIAPLSVRPMISAVPSATRDADFFPGMANGWGLTFLVNRKPSPQGRSAGGLAWAGLGNTYYWIDHGRGTAGIFLSQILPFFDPHAIALFRDFESLVNAD
ncbi:MAG: beta-lactamase family protein [Roseomonas sp.]|nr:beta-lactamase family protein [Roseomonas sp.]